MGSRWAAVLTAGTMLAAGCGSSSPGGHGTSPRFPFVPTRDGALLSPLNLVTIVTTAETQDADTLFRFSRELAGSAWWKQQASEYGLRSVTTAAEIVGPPIALSGTDHDVYNYITAAVAANGGPARDGNTLYLLYLPVGATLIEKGVPNTNCAKLGGYHARYGTAGDNLAVIQRCGGTGDPIAALTVLASHEIIEAATDPDGQGYALPPIAPHAPWNQPIWNAYDLTGHAELADLCEGTYVLEGDFYYQRIWSNAQAQAETDPCAPRLPEPFYDALFDADWYPIAGGQATSIPMRGWSSGTISTPWPVKAFVASASQGFSVTVNGNGMLSRDQTSSLSVTAALSATSGTFAVIQVRSERPKTETPLTDGAHHNYVGVYVP